MSYTPGLQKEESEEARAELDVNERQGMEFARAYLAAIIESSDDAIVSMDGSEESGSMDDRSGAVAGRQSDTKPTDKKKAKKDEKKGERAK